MARFAARFVCGTLGAMATNPVVVIGDKTYELKLRTKDVKWLWRVLGIDIQNVSKALTKDGGIADAIDVQLKLGTAMMRHCRPELEGDETWKTVHAAWVDYIDNEDFKVGVDTMRAIASVLQGFFPAPDPNALAAQVN